MTFKYSPSYLLMLLFFIPLTTFSQVDAPSLDSPYPLNNRPSSEKEAAFIALFDDTNVGNLHVYTTKKSDPMQDYFYKGKEMSAYYTTMLPKKWRKKTRGKAAKAYAVKNIAGAEREFYIIRFLDKKSRNHLALFELQQENLIHKMTLAQAWCKGPRCYQKDTWIQDIDGDTLLDLIVKTRRERNSLTSDDVEVYQQTKAGNFVKNTSLNVDSTKYPLEKL